MKIFRYLKTVRKEINIIVGVFFVIWMIKVFWLNSIPAPFSCFPRLGDLVEKLCASIISSYVFYFFVVHWKAEEDKEAVNPYVSIEVKHIISLCLGQLHEFSKVSGVDLTLDNLEKTSVEVAFEKIKPHDYSSTMFGFPPNLQRYNWLQYMGHYANRTRKTIDKLFQKITFLDSKLVQHLAGIHDCTHFGVVQNLVTEHAVFTNSELTAWANEFFNYCVLIKKLDEYEKTKLAKYSKRK